MDSKQNRYLYDKKTVLKNEKTSGLPEPLGLYNPVTNTMRVALDLLLILKIVSLMILSLTV